MINLFTPAPLSCQEQGFKIVKPTLMLLSKYIFQLKREAMLLVATFLVPSQIGNLECQPSPRFKQQIFLIEAGSYAFYLAFLLDEMAQLIREISYFKAGPLYERLVEFNSFYITLPFVFSLCYQLAFTFSHALSCLSLLKPLCSSSSKSENILW